MAIWTKSLVVAVTWMAASAAFAQGDDSLKRLIALQQAQIAALQADVRRMQAKELPYVDKWIRVTYASEVQVGGQRVRAVLFDKCLVKTSAGNCTCPAGTLLVQTAEPSQTATESSGASLQSEIITGYCLATP